MIRCDVLLIIQLCPHMPKFPITHTACNCSSHSLSMQCDQTSGQCPCIQGAAGQFCELCSRGYARASMNPADPCQKCNCNNLTLDCNVNTGVCIGCTGNSTGDHCETCQPGYYGDPTRGIPCLPCGCLPLNPNVVHTCTLESDGLPTCDWCDVGHTGRKCDQCTNGYYGISTVSSNDKEGCPLHLVHISFSLVFVFLAIVIPMWTHPLD